jgi:excisionase family DNA binding protein
LQQHPNTKSTNREKATYSVDDLAAVLGLGRQATYTGLRTGLIPSIRIGKRYVVPRSAIESWLAAAASR